MWQGPTRPIGVTSEVDGTMSFWVLEGRAVWNAYLVILGTNGDIYAALS